MTRKRQYNTIQTDYLETKIALYLATGRHEEASVIYELAQDINAPIDGKEIEKLVANYRKHM
jgi:hypothetical protein